MTRKVPGKQATHVREKLFTLPEKWRTGWDSNPRYAFTYTRVPGVRLKPLGHLSV